jgi:hypothetical protein
MQQDTPFVHVCTYKERIAVSLSGSVRENSIFALGKIRAMVTIIASYLMYLRKAPPSKQRDAEIALLQGIQQRVLATVPTEGGIVLLATEELQALANAMEGFVKLTRQVVPSSAERDELLEQVAAIREHLLHMLKGKNN